MEQKRDDIHNSDVPVLCRSCEARHRGMCGALSAAELTELARYTHKARVAPGKELAAEGSAITSYANVTRGAVKLSKGLEDGRRQVVGLQFAPDLLGRLFAAENAVSAEAASEVELCIVPRASLEGMIEATPALQHRLMQQALRELDGARDWLVTLGRKTAEEKVASFLLLIATQLDPGSETARFELPLSRTDIADFLGLTIETVSRQLSRLKESGVIALDGLRGVEIPDIAALRKLAD